MRKSWVICLMLISTAHAASPPAIQTFQPLQIFQNWLLDRCIGKVLADKAVREDAFKSASVWLEHSKLPIEAFNDGDKLINEHLNMKLTGAVEGDFNVLKCTLVSQSKDAQHVYDKYNK